MGEQSATMFFNNKVHKDLLYQDDLGLYRFHTAMYKGNECYWEQLDNIPYVLLCEHVTSRDGIGKTRKFFPTLRKFEEDSDRISTSDIYIFRRRWYNVDFDSPVEFPVIDLGVIDYCSDEFVIGDVSGVNEDCLIIKERYSRGGTDYNWPEHKGIWFFHIGNSADGIFFHMDFDFYPNNILLNRNIVCFMFPDKIAVMNQVGQSTITYYDKSNFEVINNLYVAVGNKGTEFDLSPYYDYTYGPIKGDSDSVFDVWENDIHVFASRTDIARGVGRIHCLDTNGIKWHLDDTIHYERWNDSGFVYTLFPPMYKNGVIWSIYERRYNRNMSSYWLFEMNKETGAVEHTTSICMSSEATPSLFTTIGDYAFYVFSGTNFIRVYYTNSGSSGLSYFTYPRLDAAYVSVPIYNKDTPFIPTGESLSVTLSDILGFPNKVIYREDNKYKPINEDRPFEYYNIISQHLVYIDNILSPNTSNCYALDYTESEDN